MRVFFTVFVALFLCGCTPADDKQQLLDQATEAHGGYDKLKAASTWIADIRRYQRGDSYVMTNYYRPGMVRLEQENADGEKSADVIGHPHCWGKHGPIVISCSDETRENDRPRVIMEMAVQLWPLQGSDWSLLTRSEEMAGGLQIDVLEALYRPLDSKVTFRFDRKTQLLHSMSIHGVKGGELGTHTHEYSEFNEHCGVIMADHNVKSFEGRIWVEEDVLSLECGQVDEAFFVRPAQVAEGYIEEQSENGHVVACVDGRGTRDELATAVENAGIDILGGWQEHILNDEKSQLCVAVQADPDDTFDDLFIKHVPASDYLAIYSMSPSAENVEAMTTSLKSESLAREYDMRWPVRVMIFDNDGMGLTGETVVQVSAAVGKN
ncbi:MAG: hypothetical protein HOI35_16805 [Woeseia sp.]|jgi:hypothetical protein|nr:hypothetical protein [Woeseia sp.]